VLAVAPAVTMDAASSLLLYNPISFFSLGLTTTGSVIAFGKLNGSLSSSPLQLAQRDYINMAMGAGTLGYLYI